MLRFPGSSHELSRSGIRVTVFEADDEPGGMLLAGVPSYRLPRDVVRHPLVQKIVEAAAQRLAQIMRQTPNVGSRRTGDIQHHSRQIAG